MVEKISQLIPHTNNISAPNQQPGTPIEINFIKNSTPNINNGLVIEKTTDLTTIDGARVENNPNISLKFSNSGDLSTHRIPAENAVKDLSGRMKVEGQYLSWIEKLPKEQLKNLDNLYKTADAAKADGSTELAIIGMGGSRNPSEAMVQLFGKENKVSFYSGMDERSFDRFIGKVDLDKTKFMIVSKSGTTLETMSAYENIRKKLQEHFKQEDVSDRFIAITDKSENSNLRKAVNSKEIKFSGVVHDDVGGRFSILDDASIIALAYTGVDKQDVKKMLNSSLEAQKEFLNPDIKQNEALQVAAFNTESQNNGRSKAHIEYFGDYFGGLSYWEKQLKNESLKHTIATETNIGPGFLHYNAESDLDDNNKDSFYTFVHVQSDDSVENVLFQGATKAYKAQHPVLVIELNDLSPEVIGRYVELKHFETVYTGMMSREENGVKTNKEAALPELTQGNVERYKKEVKAFLKNK